MSSPVVTATPVTPFRELVKTMNEHRVSALPIVEDGRLVGIVTEADLVSKEAYGGRRRGVLEVLADLVSGGEARWAVKAKGVVADQLMTRDITRAAPDDDVRAVARLMVDHSRTRLPVVEDGRLVGIVCRRDLLALFLRGDDELRAAIERRLAEAATLPDGAEVEVSVTGGRVHLRGSVTFPSHRRIVDALVWDVPGVVSVLDGLEPQRDEPRVVPS
jgi:CBS domain-containing protein